MFWLLGCLPELSKDLVCTYTPDRDGDGFGSGVSIQAACAEVPAGYTQEAGDCADDDRAVHPGAAETCDGVDQDCDGVADKGAPGAQEAFADVDGDGFGAASQGFFCELEAGLSAVGGDCDDERGDIFPGADETCDGVDQNCDGNTDEDATDPSTWYADGDGDGWGSGDALESTCDGPPGAADQSGDCDESNAQVHPGQEEWFTEAVESSSWDYDCDGAVTLQYPDSGSCQANECTFEVGWKGGVPGCGEAGVLVTGCDADDKGKCSPRLVATTQGCR